jgi:hypothetical protein
MTALAALLSAAITAACPVTHVHYTPYPGVGAGLGAVPWIETSNRQLYGHLFYFEGTPWRTTKPLGARIFTTVVQRRISPKVLWLPRRPTGPAVRNRLRIHGTRLDAPGAFTTRYPGYPGDFPSFVLVPHAGCWRVTITDGRLSGSVAFAAVDSF